MLRIATSPKGSGNCSFEVRFCKSAVFFPSDALAPPLGELASGSETERVSDSPLPFFFFVLRETAQNRTSFVKEFDTEFTVFSCDKGGTVLSCK